MNRVKGSVSRPLALAIALALPGSALAVGLGEARVDSYLNQPLDVRMRLLDATADELDSLTVVPASPDEFERLGLMSGALALGLEISVDRSQSPPVVRVRSSRPVNDPVVQLLIDARWSGGRMLREYTLFLDPSTVPVAPPPAEPSRRETPSETSTGRSEETPRTQPRPTSDEPRARARLSGRYGPVASGDTLWSIARDALPASDISMDQMMIAIVELNPNAFRDGNINLLLRGAELELPTAEQARAVDAAMAAAAVAEQNRAFGAGIAAALPVVSDAARGTPAGAGDDDAPGRRGSRSADSGRDPVDHRLELVPPDDQEGGSGLSDDAAEVASLRQQLARTEEELYAARQEADEFRERLSELETLIDQRDGGVGLRDAELASLEQTLRDAREATREDADPALRARVSERLDQYIADFAEPAGGGLDPGTGDEVASDESSSPDDERMTDADADDARQSAPEQPEPAAAQSSEPVTTEVGGERTWFGFRPWMVLTALGAIVIAVLGLLGAALGRRRKAGDSGAAHPSSPPRRREAEADPVEAARATVAKRPSDLAAHVALLHTLSAHADEREFGEALEHMFEHVETGNEPEWREALELAERIVPGHALVKGSSDWVADDQADAQSEPQTELDREVEVDDLMSRLDADMEESDDSDWLRADDEDRPIEEDSGPLLRGEDKPDDSAEDPWNDDDERDFGAWLANDAAEPESGVDVTADSEPEPAPESEPRSETDSEPESDDSLSDELMMDWPDTDSGADSEDAFEGPARDATEASDDAPADLGAPLADESADDKADEGWAAPEESAEPGDDGQPDDGTIFSQGDDDVEVKLDLARAYVSWNSTDSARTLLEEILREGNDEQQAEARKLLDGLSDDDGD